MEELESCLQDLQLLVEEPVKAEQVIKRVSQILRKLPEEGCTDILIFLIFEENGIIQYVRKVVASEENKNNVLSAFQLLEFLLINYERFCIPYVSKIQQLCLGIVQGSAPAKIKENSVKLLKCAFAPCFIVYLDISNVIRTISNVKDDVSGSVKSQLYSLMGIIFENAPEVSHSEKDEFLQNLLIEMGKLRKNNSIMIGCFNAICGYLVNFQPKRQQIAEIYLLLKDHCMLKEDQTRRMTERSALKVIERHYRVFAAHIYKDIEYWRNALEPWVNKTREDRQLGYSALVSIYRAFAYVFETSNQKVTTEKLNEIVEGMLNSLGSTFKIANMVCVVELASTGFVREDLANRVMQFIRKRISNTTNSRMYLSTNLECVTKYMTKSKSDKLELLLLAEGLAVGVIENYPKIDSNYQHRSLEALERSFYHLRQWGDRALDEYVKEVIYQGLVRTCSHQIVTDVELIRDVAGMDMVSYKSYLPLWLYLLNISSSDLSDVMVPEKIFDEYVSSFLRINKKLDLRVEMKNPQVTDPEEAGEAIRPNDFKIFINNVSLFVDVTEDLKNPDMMGKWLPLIFTEAVNSSYKSPLISGFYKVITSCLKIADKITYFWDPVTDLLKQPDSESDQWFRHLQKFLQDVSVRVGRYKGELQISCFQLFLSAPMKLIEPFLQDLVPIFRVILRVGSGHLPLLRECLSTLEKWYECLGKFDSCCKEAMDNLLRSILPYFNVFLQSKDRGNGLEDTSDMKWRSRKVRGRVQKIRSGESELVNIQKKFLLFLGKLDQDICKELIRPIDDGEDEVEESRKLAYVIPLTDVKLRVHLDEMIPRVIELSLSSTDRQTRINACEFLHAVLLLTFGNMKQMNGELDGLFTKLISTCLTLGCDSDLIVFQMYEPLMMQMVHYHAERERESSQTFVTCLMESVSHPYDSTLRDFAAKLIREFTVWCVKGRNPGETPNNLKTILGGMYSYSLHPDHNKRCGAALVFNNIASIIQEETDVLNTHWFLLYFHFMECLNMCSVYDDTTHIISAVEYIKTTITENSLTSRVKLPSGFQDNSAGRLMEFVFSRCTHSNSSIRILSMGLFEAIEKYYGSVRDFCDVASLKPEYLKDNANVKEYTEWLEYNTTLFSYYNWLLTQEAVTESDLLSADVDKLLGAFLNNLTPHHPWFEIHTKRIAAIVEMLQFLTSVVKIGVVWHKESAVRVIKTCLFTPSEFKLDLCDLSYREKMDAILVQLLPRLADRLDMDEIGSLTDLDCGITRLHSYLHPDKSIHEVVERVNGLKMIHRLGLWRLGFHRKLTGEDILNSVFKSVFQVRPGGTFSINVRPGDKIFLEDLLRFGTEIGMSLDVVFGLLINREEIYDSRRSEKSTKGEFFMSLFNDFLYDCMISQPEVSVNSILQKFPTNCLDLIVKLMKHASRLGHHTGKFITEISKRWSQLEELTPTGMVLLSVVKGMCMVEPNTLLKESQISEWVHRIMTTVRSLEDVESVCELIPYMSDLNEVRNERLTSSLDTFYRNLNFFDGLACPKVNACYEGLLKGFARTKSLPILQEITKFLEKYALMNEENTDALGAACHIDVHEHHTEKILTFLYRKAYDSVEASTVCQCLLEKILGKCERDTAWKFLMENLDDVVTLLKSGKLEVKISALKTVQECVTGVQREKLENLPGNKKEAFRSLIVICTKTECCGGEPELLRKYACACFNTLCTVIVAKTNDPVQYKCLIFKDDFSILPHLINREKVWSLRMDFDELPKTRKVLTSLRKTITKERQLKLGKSINSIKYLEGETLFESSLREDVTRFDFSSSFIRSAGRFGGGREEPGGGMFHMELEMDDLNKHECMVTIIGVIQYLVDEGITPEGTSIPFWLSSLLRRLTSLNSTENEKIFLLKLMHNVDGYLKPYAEHVIPDLLSTLLDVFHQKPINYLVIDIITMILNWKTNLSKMGDRLRAIITHLAIYVVKMSDMYRKDIIKSNVEIAKMIIESCKDIVNERVLTAKASEGVLTEESINDSSMNVNLHFCCILLANSIPPWPDSKEEEFLRSVLQRCRNTGKLEKLAAHVCGMTLRYLENSEGADRLVELVRDKFQQYFTANGFSDLSLVYSIHKSYPKISSSFVQALRACAWRISGPFQVNCLEMLLSHVKRLPRLENDMFGSTIRNFLEDMFSVDDQEALPLALQITEAVLELTEERLGRLVEKALTFSECKMNEVRKAVYNIAILVFERWEDRFSGTMPEDIHKQCKIVLLRGMNDSNADFREKCGQFWYLRTRGSTPTEQFSRALTEVYAAETEDNFLNFAARLIIGFCVASPDYKTFIFEHPLVQNSSFRVRNILKTVQTSTIVPMFAQTLTGQLSQPGLLQSPSLMQTLFLQGTIQQDGVASTSDEEETSKRAKRFVRDSKKVQLQFAKRHRTKKAEVETQKKIELLREYTDGDYPNIQITHQDLLKPLEVLTMKDPQIGRYFLTSVYDGFVERVEVRPFLEKIKELVQQVMENSTESNPSFIAFLFHALLRCEGCIQVDSEWVARVAKSSGCLSLGKLLIEEMITRAEWDEEERNKQSGLTPTEKKWLNMAEICRDLKEFEVLRGIFLDKLRVVGSAADAIRSESVSHWNQAAELYESVLKFSHNSLTNFYEDAYSNCLARLSDWTKLNEHIEESYSFEDMWTDLKLSEKVLPWFMRSKTMKSLVMDGGKSMMAFVKKVEECPDKEPDLKKYFVEELAITYFSQGKFEWLRYHLYQILKNFLSSWSHWNKWSNALRRTKLMELQLPWELESCSSVLTREDGAVTELLDQWWRNHPKDADDLLTWDVKLTCRNRFLSMMNAHQPDVVKSSILADFGMVRAGIAQRNVQLTEKYIRRIEGKLNDCCNDKFEFMHEYYVCSLDILRQEMHCTDGDERCRRYVSAVVRLMEIGDRRDVFSFESNLALSRVMDKLGTDIEHASADTLQEVATRLGTLDVKVKKLGYLKKALEVAGNDADLQSKTFMEMVEHYRTHVGYTTEMATCLLRAMSCGNPEARQLFCCLLNEPKFASDWVANSNLRSVCRMIPAWMYLTWTNQILANLDSEMFPFLKEILQLLTDEYPNSIRYPFGLSKERYTFKHPRYGLECRRFVEQLERKLLSDRSHLDFLTALSYVTPPDLVFRYDMDILLAELNQLRPKWDRIVGIARDLHKRMYGEEYRSFRGAIFDGLGSVRQGLEELLTLKHEKSDWTEKIGTLVKTLPKINTDNVNLKSFSPWLYHSVRRNATFELPRQQNEERPISNSSVTIWSFKSNVLVMNSKCRPIRITVLGNDAKEHRYLIKFGEDLRQDQRIQQVFGHMNRVLRRNQHTSGLSIDTYTVLPLKCNLGMIEWISNTSSLHELLTEDEGVRRTMERVQQEHLEFLAGDDGVTKVVSAHLNGYLKVNRTEAVSRFNERIHSFSWDLLRRAFWRMSLYPEQFVHMRNNFATTQAVIYIAHWLVGIGDRHLDNTLVSSKTGRALGIDFGCAFGFATEFQTPPELLPFRLTPQIANLMKPMGETVLIKEAMIQTLKAFRRERDILIAAVEVFASEPTLDWLKRAKSRTDGSGRSHKWDPRRKVAFVAEKLKGINPVKIFADDLVSGHSNTPYLEKYLEVLHGDRSQSRFGSFTEEEQVHCLIDLATDYHILCKTYVGWNPWL